MLRYDNNARYDDRNVYEYRDLDQHMSLSFVEKHENVVSLSVSWSSDLCVEKCPIVPVWRCLGWSEELGCEYTESGTTPCLDGEVRSYRVLHEKPPLAVVYGWMRDEGSDIPALYRAQIVAILEIIESKYT